MNNFSEPDLLVRPAKPDMIKPVLIGGGAIAASVVIPVLNFVNLLCCAGVMGGAVLGVWMYKRSFPEGLPFGVSDGATIGALSGVVGAILNTIVIAIEILMASANGEFLGEFEAAVDQMPQADPAQAEQVIALLRALMENPMLLVAVIGLVLLLLFAGFGAIGGLIGGAIFKTKPESINTIS